jgi:hypothetical protein
MNLKSIKELSIKLGRHQSTIVRWFNRDRGVSAEEAKKLEAATAVPRLAWLYPDEFENPYMKVKKCRGSHCDEPARAANG